MQEERYGLLMSCSVSGEEQLGKLISYVFSNEHIYINYDFRKLIQQDRKGYIPIRELLKYDSIQHYFEEIQLDNDQYKLIFLKSTINEFCRELHYFDQRVRRLNPWRRNTVESLKPICLDRLRQQLSISDIRDYFGQDSFTTSAKIEGNQSETVLVYVQNGMQACQKLDKSTVPFDIYNYAEFCRERARQARYWETAIERSYRALTYQRPQKKHHHHKDDRDAENHYRRYPKSNIQHSDSQGNEDTNDSTECTFNQLVKNPNPGFNRLLNSYINGQFSSAQLPVYE